VGKISPTDSQGGTVKKLIFILLASILVSEGAMAASFEPAWGRDGMLVTSVGPAAWAGQQILEKGGNAADAAIATAFAAAVAHPFSSGVGGGMFAVVHNASDGISTTLDARETAPAAATSEFYLKNPQSIRSGTHSVAVPGMVQGAWALHQKYGSMPWKDLLVPAIKMAGEGVRVEIWHHNVVKRVAERLKEYPETQRIQTVDGMAPPLGWNHVQADLAETLRWIQKKGGKALAVGPIAAKIAKATDNAVTELDLARYEVKWREPIRGSYRDYEIVSMPPPSSGGILLVQMLNILSRHDLGAMNHGSSDYVHLLASTMKMAFEDRAGILGDSDFYDVPVERLISMEYADQQAARFNPQGQVKARSDHPQVPDDAGTTHISVIDKYGNAVALTQTINTLFGSKITVPGTGVVLNNEMDDFSVGPELANAWGATGSSANEVAPGKRPLSSMAPTLVLQDGNPVMAIGSPMGTLIITAVLQTLINVIDFNFDAQRAVNAPRFHHQWKPDRLTLEPEFPIEVRERLQSLGYELREFSIIGAAELALFDPRACMFWGGADGRRDSRTGAVNTAPVASPSETPQCMGTARNTAEAVPD
jgi:gamma-glutamyltranspeptidase/glutathione hydrolase